MLVNRSLAPLRHRQFALLWSGAFISNIGTWMETVGVGILVTERTHTSIWSAIVLVAGFAPGALLGPVGGALADRFSRRRLMLSTTVIQTILAGLLAVLAATTTPHPATVAFIVLCSGCANAIGFPSYMAMLPDLVPEEDLVGAVALSSAQWNLGRVIGPALAGVAIVLGGYAWAFACNTASFFAVIGALLLVRLPPMVTRQQSIPDAIRQGARYTARDPGLRVVVGYMALNTFLAAPFIALIPSMSINVLGAGKAGTSVLTTAQGLGAVVMAFSLGSFAARFGNRRVLISVLWSLPIALALYAIAPTLALSAIALVLVGFLYLGALSSFISIAQLRAPNEVRGRVVSVLQVMLGALYPLGALLQGALADAWGLRVVTAGSGLLMLGLLAVARLTRPNFADALESPAMPFEGAAAGTIEAI